MNKRFYLLIVLFVAVAMTNLFAQPKINFDESSHNFGSIDENGGKVSHTFNFVNTGDKPLLVQRVNASCGCTISEWTETPVEPGGKGIVKVIFNPIGRPGGFNKLVNVYSNASNEYVRLTIHGNVFSKTTEKELKSSFPIEIDKLRLVSKSVRLGNVDKGKTSTTTLGILNDSKSKLSVDVIGLSDGFSAQVVPSVLEPEQTGVIKFSFDSNKTSEWGNITNDVFLKINGVNKNSGKDKITLSVDVVEDFSHMSIQEKRNAPILEIKSPLLNFGRIRQGHRVKGKIDIKNVGINELEIRKINNTNSDISIQPARMIIKGSKTGQLRIEINTGYLSKGDYKKTFSIQTNDPINTTIVYTVQFSVI